MEWQPIETAPKDGTVILTWTDGLGDGAYMPMAYNAAGGWSEYWGNSDLLPTHWMPLPPAPVQS